MGLYVKYPSMERQDLTQAQLGSFKFTPVDEIARDSTHPHPLLLQQYTQSLQNGGMNLQLSGPDIATDSSFFNHQIRPSLDSSRLRLGPAAVRAAVKSAATSPQKRFNWPGQDSMHPNAHSFYPQSFHRSTDESIASMYNSEANSAPVSDESMQAFPNANTSLLRALEVEQQAHETTKSQLEYETHGRLEAEAETSRLVEHNKGLLNSIRLLQSTVKHMVQKEHKPALEYAVQDFKNQVNSAQVNDSILYDVLSNYKVPHKTVNNGQESTSMIDLDLLNTPNSNDMTEKAKLQRELRRQMDLSSGSGPKAQGQPQKKDLNIEYQQKIESIVKGYETSALGAEGEQPEDNQLTQVANGTIKIPAASDETPASSDADQGPIPRPILATPDIPYELPASFLSKYAKKPADAAEPIRIPSINSENLPPPSTPRKGMLTVRSAIKTQDVSKEEKLTRVIYMPDSPVINWNIDGRHYSELRGNHVETHTDSHFRSYPIRYVPSLADESIFRTIMIDFIPTGTTYCDLLKNVRGGRLESVQLYGPIGDATDFVTARIVYTDETGAFHLYKHGQDPGIIIGGQRVRVWQVLEPTYPKNKDLEEAIYVNGHSRILVINAPIDKIDDILKRKLRRQSEQGLVLDIGRSHDGMPMVEFTSIEEATKALKRFLDDRDFSGCDFDFEEDYCAARYT